MPASPPRPPRLRPIPTALLAACATSNATAPSVPPPQAPPESVIADVTLPPPPPPSAPAITPAVAEPVPGTWRVSKRLLEVRRAPTSAARRGWIAPNAPFSIVATADGAGCAAGWGEVLGGGTVCLDGTEPTETTPAPFPPLAPFDPPEPLEWYVYAAEGHYARAPVAGSEALLPFIYAKPYRTKWTGQLYASVAAFERGDSPIGAMQRGDFKYSFVRAEDTSRGTVVVRKDGKVAAARDVFFYPVDRFSGRRMDQNSPPPGRIPGWVMGYDGAPLYASPDRAQTPAAIVPYHHELDLLAEPADAERSWWVLPDALGPGIAGYLFEDPVEPTFRRHDPLPPPSEIESGQVWIDVDLRQQILTVYKGSEPFYMTLVSTGREYGTPVGLYRVFDKFAYHDMEGRPDAEYDPYRVEDVPWTMHFYPRYALHAAFWHWGFGHTASHGCVNLAPRDAKFIYEHITPTVGPGWLAAYESKDEPGTIVRVHRDDPNVPDKRSPL